MLYSKEELIEIHRRTWIWLSKHPAKSRSDWPEWEKNGGNIKMFPEKYGECVACYWADYKNKKLGRKTNMCKTCLFVWPQIKRIFGCADCHNSYFGEWVNIHSPLTSESRKKRIRIALKIASLEVR